MNPRARKFKYQFKHDWFPVWGLVRSYLTGLVPDDSRANLGPGDVLGQSPPLKTRKGEYDYQAARWPSPWWGLVTGEMLARMGDRRLDSL